MLAGVELWTPTDRNFMHVFCTTCQFTGVIDALPASSETQPVCARCATTLEAIAVTSEEQPATQSTGFDLVSSDQTAVERRDAGVEQTIQDFLDIFEAQRAPLSIQPEEEPSETFDKASPLETVEQNSVEVPAAEPLRVESVVPESSKVAAAHTVPLKPQAYAVSPKARASRWSLRLPNPFKPRHGHRAFASRDKYFLLRISPVIVLSCVLVYLSLSSLSDLVAQPSGRAEKGGVSQQSSGVAEAPQPAVAAAPLPSGKEEALLTAPQGVAPTGYAETATSEPATADESADESADEVADEAAYENADEGADGGDAAEVFTAQVGSYLDSEEANAQCALLNSAGVESWMVKVEIPGRGTWYRVQAGRFASRDEAARFGAQLKADRKVRDYLVTALEQ